MLYVLQMANCQIWKRKEWNGSGINDDGDGEIPFDRLVWIWSSDLKQEESDFLHKLHVY